MLPPRARTTWAAWIIAVVGHPFHAARLAGPRVQTDAAKFDPPDPDRVYQLIFLNAG
jgi:hypothetical protein